MRYIYILLLLVMENLYSMNTQICGQIEPDKDLVFDRDLRTKTQVVTVQSYNRGVLKYYADNKKLARIASFDGGGVRGIGPAYWCSHLERSTKKSMADMFNLFAGTSTGAVIASSLVMPKDLVGYSSCTGIGNSLYSGDDIVNFYINDIKPIFKSRYKLGYLFISKYQTASAYSKFKQYFGNTKLSQIRSDCDLLIPYYNLTNNAPSFFKSNKAKISAYSKDKDYYLSDVIASTTAAPTFFREFKLYTAYNKDNLHKKNYIYAIDGGVAANDPSFCALTEAMSLYKNSDAFLLLSMGTGHCVSEAHPRGLLSWAYHISDILMKNTSEMSSHMMKKFGMYSSKPVFFSRLQFDVSQAHKNMDNTDSDNLAYLMYQAQESNISMEKLSEIGKVLKDTDKPARNDLLGREYISKTNFMEI